MKVIPVVEDGHVAAHTMRPAARHLVRVRVRVRVRARVRVGG